MSSILGKLWVVATPLGNLGDFSPRAKSVLSSVQLILAEDTRRAGLLLSQANISYNKLTSFHEFNEDKKVDFALSLLEEGAELALISDAGTPLVSDPGFKLIRACRERSFSVSPLPGPSAPIAALSVSGLAPLPFTFLGFLPRKEQEQAKLFSQFVQLESTLIFFERKDRVKKSLGLAFQYLGEREYTIAREITKTYEEFIHGNLSEWETLAEDFLGELTIVVGPPKKSKKSDISCVLDKIKACKGSGLKAKEVAKAVAEQLDGWSSKEVYLLLQKENYE